MEQQLLADIRAFLEHHGMAPSRFGRLAVNDKNFVRDLEAGNRRLLIQTESRVRRFIDEFNATPATPLSGGTAGDLAPLPQAPPQGAPQLAGAEPSSAPAAFSGPSE
jgi:hypothetical protein